MSCEKRSFGFLADGREVFCYTLKNRMGAYVTLSEFGAALVECAVPDKNGSMGDVALGFSTVTPYTEEVGSIGAVCGRFANRIANASFMLNGKPVHVTANVGKNHLHGGKEGFNHKLWQGNPEGDKVTFTLLSPDGEEGYPGALTARVTYAFDESNTLTLSYWAQSTKDTVINLTNHSYWNMEGADSGSARGNLIRIHAARYTPLNEEKVPAGVIEPLPAALDLQRFTKISDGLLNGHEQLRIGNGYDFNYIINRTSPGLTLAAELYGPVSGRKMSVYTTLPGIQFYSGNFLGGFAAKNGAVYNPGAGMALETQLFPDSPNHPEWPSCLLRPGETYTSETRFSFSAE